MWYNDNCIAVLNFIGYAGDSLRKDSKKEILEMIKGTCEGELTDMRHKARANNKSRETDKSKNQGKVHKKTSRETLDDGTILFKDEQRQDDRFSKPNCGLIMFGETVSFDESIYNGLNSEIGIRSGTNQTGIEDVVRFMADSIEILEKEKTIDPVANYHNDIMIEELTRIIYRIEDIVIPSKTTTENSYGSTIGGLSLG
ncbi:MAG TPA: hypothetical protein DCP90_05370 [Clostridiales bacterium]|nr:MAG: hypothetical protein A2Y22_08835 [Clostridiales bacterium GWD2_32_59]HAN10030.1 hypothetical protein [Clostridiales bacterium]